MNGKILVRAKETNAKVNVKLQVCREVSYSIEEGYVDHSRGILSEMHTEPCVGRQFKNELELLFVR